jgi:hypothetical protein
MRQGRSYTRKWRNRVMHPVVRHGDSNLLPLSLSGRDNRLNRFALGTRGLSSTLAGLPRRSGNRGHGSRTSTALHGNIPFFPVLPRLGQFLEVLLGVRSDLHHSTRLDQRSDLFPALAVLFQSLQKEAMLFCCPATCVLSSGTESTRLGSGSSCHCHGKGSLLLFGLG